MSTVPVMSPAAERLDVLDALELPVVDGRIDWESVSVDQFHDLMRGAAQRLDQLEPNVPTDGVLQRSVQLEESARALMPLQHRYAGLLEDAFNVPKLRSTIDLPKGKTPFRDAKDLLAKTHGLRAYEATGRMKIARATTPARASDPERDDSVPVGETKYPLLGELQAQGRIHPSKFSTALNVLDELDEHAQDAGKDQAFRDALRQTVERNLAERIEHTTPEEFSRYASRRKADLIGAMDPPDKNFTDAQTQRMYGLRNEGNVRGNPNAYKWSLITDAEGNEVLKTLESMANNPRNKNSDDGDDAVDGDDVATLDAVSNDETPSNDEVAAGEQAPATEKFDHRTRDQRAMHMVRDALKFALANLHRSRLPGANGNHTKMMVIVDYPTLMQHVRDQLADLLPEIDAQRREMLLGILAQMTDQTDSGDQVEAVAETPLLNAAVLSENSYDPEISGDVDPPDDEPAKPPDGQAHARTTNLEKVLESRDLDRLQDRIAQGIYTPHYPPEILLRLMCDVDVSPVTLTGEREILSVGREQRQFPDPIRRAILARDRGCAVPGCHWPAAWCELHHVKPWSRDGETSVQNGVVLCSHHHQTLHSDILTIERVNGEFRFIQHPLIDPEGQPRRNYFWQN